MRLGSRKPKDRILDVGADDGELYRRWVRDKLATSDETTAMQQAIGGEYEAIGAIECDLLIWQGLQQDGSVVDVGCGSGRLAVPLSRYLGPEASYLGTDVVPELLDYARRQVGRPDWRFEEAPGLAIPAEDSSADIVCFFSVMTHLRHEHSYLYLREAKRVLKPTGRIVVSFLEFAVPGHWTNFRSMVRNPHSQKHLNQFMSRDGIRAWAEHLDLDVEIISGEDQVIPLRQPVTTESGIAYTDRATLGQSVAVFTKR